MSIHGRRLLLLGSSALMTMCLAGVASSQTPTTPTESPQTTAPPTPETPSTETPQTAPAPETPQTAPTVSVPTVTVTAPPRPRTRTVRPAAPARTTSPTPSSPPARTATAAPSATSQSQRATTSPFNQPPASLTTITSNEIQASPAQSFGNLFFTLPGATSAGLSPAASRPVLRGLDDFRVRVQENGIGSMDVSDLGQDHGVPIDPLSIQKIEIYRGPEALRYGSQAVGGVVEATNNRIPFAAPLGGWQTQFLGATTTVDRGLEGGALFDAGTRDFAIHADFYGRHGNDYFVPSYPYLFPTDPALPFNGKQPNSSFHSEGQAVGGSYLFDGGYVGAAISRFTTLYHVPTLEGAQTNGRIALEQTKITSKGEFRPQSSAVDVIRFWLGAVEYHHDEIGLDEAGLDGIRATFNNHAQEAKTELKFMPMATPLGSLISAIGTQFDHQQIDTAGDAGSLLGSARTNRGAAYFFNELWLNDTLRTLLAGRIETVRLDGTAGIFPSALVPPPDNPDLVLQSLGFMPKSISFSVLKDLPSWMIASATLQRIERAPTALELFAHGAHDASGTFDIGDPGLKIETAKTAEIGLKRTDGAFRFDAKAYYTRYDNFIFRQATGILCGTSFATCGNGVDTEFIQTVYSQRDAIFRGGEIAWQWDLVPVATGIFGVDGQYDFVRATFTDGSNVPRMPPMRLGGGAYWRNDNWFVRMGLLHAFGQSDLGQNDTPTAGYNLLKMEVSHRKFFRDSPWGATEITTGLVGDNLLDVDVRNSVQFHKDEILLPGRSIKFFMNAKFGGNGPGALPPYFKGPRGYGPVNGYDPLALFKTPALATWSWAGPYVGANIGYGAGKSKTDAVFGGFPTGGPLFATGSSDNLNGGIGGIQGGYNWQWANWVGGIEADVQISGQGATPSYLCPGAICNPGIVDFDAPVTATFDQGHKLDSFGTLRARFGTTITPDVMAYATGGLAVGSIRSTVRLAGVGLDADGGPVTASNTRSVLTQQAGWTVGAGLEGRLFGNLTGKIEYLYMDFGTSSANVANPLNATPIMLSSNARITDNIVRVGLNYKLDPATGYDALTGIGAPPVYKGLPSKAPPYALPVVAEWTWAGPYLGLNAGYGWGKSNTDTVISDAIAGTPLAATTTSGKFNGMSYGAQTGFNWQFGAFVAGIEADIQNSRQPGRTTTFGCAGATCNPAIAAFGLDAPVRAQMEQRLEWFGTLRGRLGVTPTPGSLVYATGGLAVGRIKTSGTISGSSLGLTEGVIEGVEQGVAMDVDADGNPIEVPIEVPVQIPIVTASANPASSTFFSQKTKAGWTVGIGAEARLFGNWTGKIEYLYLDFGTVSTVATLPTNSTPIAINFNSRVTENLVRLGLNYKFDPIGAVYDASPWTNGPVVFKAPIRSAWTWAGFYLGGTVGYGWGRSSTETIFNDPASGAQMFASDTSRKLDGMIGGAQAGYNWVAGIWLAGVEGDLNYSGQRARLRAVCPGEICNPALVGIVGDPSVQAISEQGQKLEWFATLRGRLGATITPGAVAYVTGGLAVGEVMTAGTVFGFDADGNPVNTIVSSHNTKAGWTAGGGLEGRLVGNWTARIEYLYLDLGTVTTVPATPPNATVAAAFNSRITDNIVRVGVNYKFDPSEAIFASY
jgi:iron complex outermembrane receptor protein